MKQKWLRGQSWNAIRRDFLRSPAMEVASPAVHKLLNILLGELALHEGRDNGSLIYPFCSMRMRQATIKPAIDEAVALGLLAIKRGRKGAPGYGKAHRYRLTFMPILDHDNKLTAEPTDEWAGFSTKDYYQWRSTVSYYQWRST
jgi:hypothetical protein